MLLECYILSLECHWMWFMCLIAIRDDKSAVEYHLSDTRNVTKVPWNFFDAPECHW